MPHRMAKIVISTLIWSIIIDTPKPPNIPSIYAPSIPNSVSFPISHPSQPSTVFHFFKLKYQSRLLHNAQVSGICKMRPKLSLKVFFFCFTHLIHSNSCERVSYTHPSPVYLSVSVCANLYFATKERLQIIHIFRFLFGIFEVWIACMYTAGCFAIGEDLSWTLNRCGP